MQPHLNTTRQNMEENLNIFQNGRRPHFFLQLEVGRQPHIFWMMVNVLSILMCMRCSHFLAVLSKLVFSEKIGLDNDLGKNMLDWLKEHYSLVEKYKITRAQYLCIIILYYCNMFHLFIKKVVLFFCAICELQNFLMDSHFNKNLKSFIFM